MVIVASHVLAVTLFYGSLLFTYLRPATSYSLNSDKIVAVFYTVVFPMCNPLIYSFRNKDVKNALRKAIGTKLDFQRNESLHHWANSEAWPALPLSLSALCQCVSTIVNLFPTIKTTFQPHFLTMLLPLSCSFQIYSILKHSWTKINNNPYWPVSFAYWFIILFFITLYWMYMVNCLATHSY